MRKKLIVIIILIVSVGVFYENGRPIWKPIYQKIMGKESVSSIQEKLNEPVFERIKDDLNAAGFESFPDKLLIVGYKYQKELYIYGRKKGEWKQIKVYPFSNFSGELGPKLKEGDKQIPEGIYEIEYLNPNSAYHLSLKVSYPNEYDKEKAEQENRTQLGGDIFIHGDNVTVGCIPLGDVAIEEVFLLADSSYNSGIKVIIAPYKFGNNFQPEIPNRTSWTDELYSKIELALKEEGVR